MSSYYCRNCLGHTLRKMEPQGGLSDLKEWPTVCVDNFVNYTPGTVIEPGQIYKSRCSSLFCDEESAFVCVVCLEVLCRLHTYGPIMRMHQGTFCLPCLRRDPAYISSLLVSLDPQAFHDLGHSPERSSPETRNEYFVCKQEVNKQRHYLQCHKGSMTREVKQVKPTTKDDDDPSNYNFTFRYVRRPNSEERRRIYQECLFPGLFRSSNPDAPIAAQRCRECMRTADCACFKCYRWFCGDHVIPRIDPSVPNRTLDEEGRKYLSLCHRCNKPGCTDTRPGYTHGH